MRDTIYFKQVELLIRILPLIAREKDFALNESKPRITRIYTNFILTGLSGS